MTDGAKWFYVLQGQKYGPVPEETIQTLIATSQITPGDFVWRKGLETWTKVADVAELQADGMNGMPQLNGLDALGDIGSSLGRFGELAKESVGAQAYGTGERNRFLAAPRTDYASFWRRFGALFIDGLIMTVVNSIIVWLFMMDAEARQSEDWFVDFEFAMRGLRDVSLILYCMILEGSPLQGTVGKLLTGIRVATTEGEDVSILRSISRNLCRILSMLTCYIGYFVQPFTEKRQTLHDKLAGTVVIMR